VALDGPVQLALKNDPRAWPNAGIIAGGRLSLARLSFLSCTRPVADPGQVILSGWLTALMRLERRSEVANSRVRVRGRAWRDDRAARPARRQSEPADCCR